MLKVVTMNAKAAKGALSDSRRRWLRHQASVVVAQLPEDEDEALYVLERAKRLVLEFIREDDGPRPKPVDD